MKNIAIVTIIDRNYGNRLQNYALNYKLLTLGYNVRTISKYYSKLIYIKIIIKIFLSLFIRRYRKDIKSFFASKFCYQEWKSFNKLISWEPLNVEKNSNKLIHKYDAFITGSDQVWNFHFSATDREFLGFVPSQKRIAYAASIGLSSLPKDQENRYRKYLIDFSSISVREFAGANIIKNLINRDVPVLLDPTMLISADHWRSIMKKPTIQPSTPYIFKYFLGSRNDKYELYIENYANNNKCSIIDINQPGNKTIKGIGPAEFVSLIANSTYVCTDSFHGTVFAILFHKPFVIFNREGSESIGNMSSRLDTLLTHFSLGKRMVNSADELQDMNWDIDFSEVENILYKKREEAEKYIINSINNSNIIDK